MVGYQSRKIIVGLAQVAIAGAMPMLLGVANAESGYPSKVVNIVMPFPAGGMGDTLARILAENLSREWSQTVIVDNKPGASGMIGNKYVADAAADGYTLLLTITQTVQAPALYEKLNYDINTDFTPLSKVANALSILVANKDVGINSVDGYVQAAKKAPGKLSYGSYGAGTTSHIYSELFNIKNGLDVTHVSYRGAAPLLNDLMGGHIDVSFVDLGTSLPFIRSDRINAYAVVSDKRSAALPDIPTFKELGYEGMEIVGWYGLMGPAKMPKEVVEKISIAVQKVVNDPAVREKITDLGLEPVGTDAETFAKTIKDDQVTWKGIIQEGGVKLEQ